MSTYDRTRGDAPTGEHTRYTSEEQLRAITLGELAPLNGPIQLVEYDSEWPQMFAREANRIHAALGPRVLLLEHAGSTSVPGLAAKPIIDMALVVADSANEPAYALDLEANGYALRIREPKWYEHWLFKRTNPTINLHVFSQGCPEVESMLLFRDWLRSHPADCQLYEDTKRELAGKDWKYTQNYADAKTAVVQEILKRAQVGMREAKGEEK